jgi:hypothetical protein
MSLYSLLLVQICFLYLCITQVKYIATFFFCRVYTRVLGTRDRRTSPVNTLGVGRSVFGIDGTQNKPIG